MISPLCRLIGVGTKELETEVWEGLYKANPWTESEMPKFHKIFQETATVHVLNQKINEYKGIHAIDAKGLEKVLQLGLHYPSILVKAMVNSGERELLSQKDMVRLCVLMSPLNLHSVCDIEGRLRMALIFRYYALITTNDSNSKNEEFLSAMSFQYMKRDNSDFRMDVNRICHYFGKSVLSRMNFQTFQTLVTRKCIHGTSNLLRASTHKALAEHSIDPRFVPVPTIRAIPCHTRTPLSNTYDPSSPYFPNFVQHSVSPPLRTPQVVTGSHTTIRTPPIVTGTQTTRGSERSQNYSEQTAFEERSIDTTQKSLEEIAYRESTSEKKHAVSITNSQDGSENTAISKKSTKTNPCRDKKTITVVFDFRGLPKFVGGSLNVQ